MNFVLDCSVVMSWCFEDESNTYTDFVLERLSEDDAIAPFIWPLEIANVLLMGEKKKRITQADSSRFLELLGRLPITIDTRASLSAMGAILPLARKYNLTSYDAAYLELAMRYESHIATQDEALKNAAKHCGIILLNVS